MRNVVLLAVIGMGCKGSDKAAAPPPSPPPVVVRDAAVASVPGDAPTVVDAAPPPEDPVARATFGRELQKGRKLIAKKDYPAAITALDAALVAKPGDPRALTERGFARLLANTELDKASADLDLAAGATKDKKLLSMIWFNRGLIYEKTDDGYNALAAFGLANALRPTKAAQQKLANKPSCPILVERGPKDGTSAITAATWRDLVAALPENDDNTPVEERMRALSPDTDGAQPTLPAIVIARDAEMVAYAVWAQKTGLVAHEVARAAYARCSGEIELKVEQVEGTRMHISGDVTGDGGWTYMCEDGDTLVPCEGKDGEVPHGSACDGGSPVRVDVVLDTATNQRLIQLVQPDVGKEAWVTLVEEGLEISKRVGCDRVEKL